MSRTVQMKLGTATLTRLEKNARELSRRTSGGYLLEIFAYIAKQQIESNLDRIPNLDGNRKGRVVILNTGKNRRQVANQGEDVAYLEFGTGARGGSSPYFGNIPSGYQHSDRTRWVYPLKHDKSDPDSRFSGSAISYGLEPQMQVLRAAYTIKAYAPHIAARHLKGVIR